MSIIRKRILCLMLLVSLAVPALAVSAKNEVTAELTDKGVRIKYDGGDIVWSAYDGNGKLIGSNCVKADADGYYYGKYTSADGVRYRIADMQKGEFYDVAVSGTVSPEATVSPEVTPAPTAVTYPSIYEKQKDAYYTFGVVEDTAVVANDGDTAYEVSLAIRGGTEKAILTSDSKFVYASDSYSDFIGCGGEILQKGDIVYMPSNSRGNIVNMAFLFRPTDGNPVLDDADYGVNFEKLISDGGMVYASSANEPGTVLSYGSKGGSGRYQYAFGVVADRSGSEIALYNKSGRGADAIYIPIEDDTIVYECNLHAPKNVTIGRGGSLTKSGIPSSAFDDDGNLTYSKDYEYNYAFVRIVNGVATEAVIYKSYN